MRPMRWMTCLAIAGLLVACDEVPTDTPESATDADMKVDRTTEVVTFEDIGYVAFIPCANDGAGEDMEYRGVITWNRRIQNTPSGNEHRSNSWEFTGLPADHLLHMGPEYVLIGLTSGDVWAVDDKRTKMVERRHNFADGSWGYHQTLNMKLNRDDGEKLHIQGVYQLKMVDGEWTKYVVNRGSCPELW